MANFSGRCMCGAVTWTCSGQIIRNLVCHCTDCQRATSAPFTAFLAVNPEQLTWSGEILNYESSPGTFRGFCPSCGTRLYFRSDRWALEVHVHAATLTSPDEYRPGAQVMTLLTSQMAGPARVDSNLRGFSAKPGKSQVCGHSWQEPHCAVDFDGSSMMQIRSNAVQSGRICADPGRMLPAEQPPP